MKGKYGKNYLKTASLLDMIKVFAPSDDSNNPTSYANTVAAQLNIKPTDKLNSLQNRIPELMKAMMLVEDNVLYKELYG